MAIYQRNYSENLGLTLLKELFEHGYYIFTIEQAKEAGKVLQISENYIIQLLHLLTEGNWIIRLKRGLYGLKEGVLGNIQLHPFAIATHLVNPSAISHWSALSYYGFTEQIPYSVTAMTTKKIVTPEMREGKNDNLSEHHSWNIAGISYEYTTIKDKYYWGIEEVWVNQDFKVPITDKERTMLEGFISPRYFGGIGEVIGMLEEHIGEVNLEKIIDYGLKYGKGSVAKRLGWSLEHIGIAREKLNVLARIPVSGYSILDPTGQKIGHCNNYWKIQENLPGRIRE